MSRGLDIGAEDVMVTNGVQQAIALIGQVLLRPGDTVAVENPGYPPVRRALEAARARVVPVPVDHQGLVVDALPTDARLVYVTPAHQFPLGVRMSLQRRTALLAWAHDHRAAIVEDDYDTDFSSRGRPSDWGLSGHLDLTAVNLPRGVLHALAWRRPAHIGINGDGAQAAWNGLLDRLVHLLRSTSQQLTMAGEHLTLAAHAFEKADAEADAALRRHAAADLAVP